MSVQVRLDNTNIPFILSGVGLSENDSTLLQDGSRSTPLVFGTLMAKVAASQKWVPFIDETETDGSAHPQGIMVGPDITAAALVAGDVVDVPILVGKDVTIDEDLLVIENSKTLDTVITVGTTDLRTVRDHMATRGIFVEETIAISSAENA